MGHVYGLLFVAVNVNVNVNNLCWLRSDAMCVGEQ